MRLPPRSQFMPPRPINEYVFHPGHKETLSPVILGKSGSPHWNRAFSAWSLVLGQIRQLGFRDSMLRVPLWIRVSGFSNNTLRLTWVPWKLLNFLFTSCFNRTNDRVMFDYWGGRKTLLFFHRYGLMTWIYRLQRFGGTDQKSCSFGQLRHRQKNWC